jgi:hypothetical protein
MKLKIFSKYLEHLTHKNKNPNMISRSILRLRASVDYNWRNKFDYKRFLAINSLPNIPLNLLEDNLPVIELLLVTKTKDIELLELVISNALSNSRNPISQIKIVVPEDDVIKIQQLNWSFRDKHRIIIVNEDDVIPEQIRIKLKREFGELYGWVLAQYLKIWTVATSQSEGVLVLDADTLLLSPRIFLDRSGTQILTPSVEFHHPYYAFLANTNPFFGKMSDSFISHHMLMQPAIAKKALSVWQNSIEILTKFVFEFYDRNEKNPFCLEFEVYAQFLVTYHKDKFVFAKWSNLSVQREKIINDKSKIKKYAKKFNSISLHSWL